MKLSILILAGLTLVAAGCSHKDDGGNQRQGFNGPGRDGRDGKFHNDQPHRPRGRSDGRFGNMRRVRLRTGGPLLSTLVCIDEGGTQQQVLLDQFPNGTSELAVGSQLAIGAQQVQIVNRNLNNGGAGIILGVRDLNSGDFFQTQCQASF